MGFESEDEEEFTWVQGSWVSEGSIHPLFLH